MLIFILAFIEMTWHNWVRLARADLAMKVGHVAPVRIS